ncbi:hypothetical protein AaE_004570 [Aphanomyces astaci]|uniref:Uncharacterized protein n=1 Tax=Aphanomyces astaci TaxID=112090 RepID=A0A6A5APL6_APHAT|nr:hypothetical protein AaE_004570 [Aphanomyces astaci]
MSYALYPTPVPFIPLPTPPTRKRRADIITQMLYRSYDAQFKVATSDVFNALAMKIERILSRAFPNDDDDDLSPDVLESRLKFVIERILYSKESVALQPNNFTLDEFVKFEL